MPGNVRTTSGWVGKLFADKISGSKPVRLELDRMLDLVRDGDVVAVTKDDRLARSPKDLLEIVEPIYERGAGFRSLAEDIDTTISVARLTQDSCRWRTTAAKRACPWGGAHDSGPVHLCACCKSFRAMCAPQPRGGPPRHRRGGVRGTCASHRHSPPSITSASPVTNAERSEARYKIPSATSSVPAQRPMGIVSET